MVMNLNERYKEFNSKTHYSSVGSTKEIDIDLYHYTCAKSLKSILDNKSIWITKNDFMNYME